MNPNFFLGDYLENTDYNFKEAYLVDANGCTNWEDHDGACVIGASPVFSYCPRGVLPPHPRLC